MIILNFFNNDGLIVIKNLKTLRDDELKAIYGIAIEAERYSFYLGDMKLKNKEYIYEYAVYFDES